MITTQLLHPQSIVVVGASNNTHKPGGAILKNLINGGYQGELRAVNPKETEVQGVPSFADAKELPDTDLAILDSISSNIFLLFLRLFVRRWWKHWPERSRRGLS